MTSVNDIKALLIQTLPPGSEGLYNFENPVSKITRLFNGLANSYKQFAFDPTDSLYLEMNPVTITQNIPNWENATGLASTRTALRGSTDQRRAQIVGQLRGSGSLSADDYRDIIEPFYKYQRVEQIQIAEPNRDNLKALHDYPFISMDPITVTPMMSTNLVANLSDKDDYLSTEMGAILSFEFKGTNIEDVQVTVDNTLGGFSIASLSSPAYFGRGSFENFTTVYFYLQDPSCAYTHPSETIPYKKQRTIGKRFAGKWNARFGSFASTYYLRNVRLFVEGMGRDHIVQDQGVDGYIPSTDRSVRRLTPPPIRPGQGLSYSMFHWAPIAETALLGPNPDIPSADAIIDHLKPAHTLGGTAYKDPDEVLRLYPGVASDTSNYNSIWGTDRGNLWICTSAGNILRFNGETWVLDTDLAAGVPLNAIKGANRSNIWAVGNNGAALRYGGFGWIAAPTGIANNLLDVAAFEDGTAIVVGPNGLIASLAPDGIATGIASGTTNTLHGIYTASTSNKNDIWVVGDAGTLLRSIDGITFTSVGAPVGGNLQKISGFSSNDIYACATNHQLIHWDGITWSIVTVPSIRDFYTVAASPLSPGDTWIGTAVGEVWHQARFETSFTKSEVLPTTNDLLGSWLNNSYEMWMVGKNATIIKYAPFGVYPDSVAAIPDACIPS